MLTPIKQEEKSSLNIIFQLYKSAIKNDSVAEMNDINFIAVHNQRYPIVLEWRKLIMQLTKKWKNKVNTKGRVRCVEQLGFLLEKIEIYKKIMEKDVPENIILELEKEFQFRKANWETEQKVFTKKIDQWNIGKLNCSEHKNLKNGNIECLKCVTIFDQMITSRLKELHQQIKFLEVNKINQFNKENISNQLINSYNNLVDMRLINKDILSVN